MEIKKRLPEYLKALFLGPKAENAELVEELILASLKSHYAWRRGLFENDQALVSDADRQHPDFAASSAALRHQLSQLLHQFKQAIPNYHARYLDHMHSDLLIPGIIGQFASLFYFENNVAPGGGPVTSRLEREAIHQIAEMLGYPTAGSEAAWGHLCSGGTLANLEALWAARNLRHVPIGLFLGIRRALKKRYLGTSERRVQSALASFAVLYKGQRRRITSFKTRELLNVPLDEIIGLRERLASVLFEARWPEKVGKKGADAADLWALIYQEADHHLRTFSPDKIGPDRANQMLLEEGLHPLSDYPWSLYLSTAGHYGFEKISDLLGLGRDAVRKIQVGCDFSLDVSVLLRELERDLSNPLEAGRSPSLPLAIVAVMGSTEEGSVDDLAALARIRDYLRTRGLEFWLHGDAAYGGYAASMLRSANPSVQDALPAGHFFGDLLGDDLGKDPLVEAWSRSLDRLSALAEADSITIDPHKMGYVPYPAGVVLFRDSRAKLALSCEAPYLSADREEEVPGRYTLEGSRPGHAAAGVYLAHQLLPLNQAGHGILVGRSLLGAREFYLRVPQEIEKLDNRVRLHFLCLPALNILNYLICHDEVRTLAGQNALTEMILQEFSGARSSRSRDPDSRLFLGSTELSLKDYGHVLKPWLESIPLEVSPEEWLDGSIRIFRSVVMHPHLIEARTNGEESQRDLVSEIARRLAEVCQEKAVALAAAQEEFVSFSSEKPFDIAQSA